MGPAYIIGVLGDCVCASGNESRSFGEPGFEALSAVSVIHGICSIVRSDQMKILNLTVIILSRVVLKQNYQLMLFNQVICLHCYISGLCVHMFGWPLFFWKRIAFACHAYIVTTVNEYKNRKPLSTSAIYMFSIIIHKILP